MCHFVPFYSNLFLLVILNLIINFVRNLRQYVFRRGTAEFAPGFLLFFVHHYAHDLNQSVTVKKIKKKKSRIVFKRKRRFVIEGKRRTKSDSRWQKGESRSEMQNPLWFEGFLFFLR